MMHKLITVIIPAYNSENTISRCLDSVLSQTYNNLEIIVVDDGSVDNTSKIVSEYKNVILLCKKNGGPSSARNFGVNHANGKYVVFLDSDDYIEKDYISNLFEQTTGRNDELVMCDFLMNGKKENEAHIFLKLNNKQKIFDLFLHGGIYNRTVNKIYPLEMLKMVPFPEGRDMLEDAYFTSHILEHCNSLVRIPYAGYNYIRHNDSVSKRKQNKLGIASKYSNILEKDVVISKYISVNEYTFFANLAVDHITDCINGSADLNLYGIGGKIIFLTSFIFNNRKKICSKKIVKFGEYMCRAKTIKHIKIQFLKYTILVANFKFKYSYFRCRFSRMIRKVFGRV